jgi:hypothetical protein
MTSALDWVVPVPVRCPHCHKESVEMYGRLVDNNEIACSRCGSSVNLRTGEWQSYLQECASALGKIEAAFDKLT